MAYREGKEKENRRNRTLKWFELEEAEEEGRQATAELGEREQRRKEEASKGETKQHY